MGLRAKSNYSKGISSRGSLFSKCVCEIVNLINTGLHVWFWWVGVGNMKRTPCGTYIMMYVLKTGMLGWARKIMMAMSLFVLICTIYRTTVEFLRPWTLWRISKARQEFALTVEIEEQLISKGVKNPMALKEKFADADSMYLPVSVGDASPRPSSLELLPETNQFSLDREALWCPNQRSEHKAFR